MIILNLESLRKETNYGQTQLHPRIISHPNENINQILPTINMRYTPYFSDQINDAGWGCAWRSIQMMLSSQYNITPEFRWLFSFFGSKAILEKIYMHMNQVDQIPQYLSNSQYSPHDLDNGWAEPYIGHLILYYMGFQSKLFLINGYPPHSNAPKEVFAETFSFPQFKLFLQEHFTQRKSPIQIDDSKYSMVIYDYKSDGDNTILFIGDPHIYYIQNNHQKIGLYTVTLNEKGDQISNSITPDQAQFYMYASSYQTLHFNEKNWMAACIIKSQDVWLDWRERQLII
ncbi:unnamed protein product (macronuclear) [Paramecium tetraurelia]|uniref:UFSP1/2/DUB catalytic domain-containing protein n=1 Tax=Paramecium tetraurelia TaxID=5888 RepID=A0DJ01_PARTE|nr:uncharacterized protein GSPATT00017375001 [Paramecium tetraurelia]CAK83018.1 unnamed protein product [Paramecium tetraurelia]|eukprot:XP_001450415.1 hypothetical protein (macronuclear) [Paramecium tetraurelia strain d4-2]